MGDATVFDSYSPSQNNLTVQIADGSLSKDLNSEKMIGNAEECSGLYILKEGHYPQEQPQVAVNGAHSRGNGGRSTTPANP
ncbi:hypothetical protein ACLOJK_040467 [Asimina triloba]